MMTPANLGCVEMLRAPALALIFTVGVIALADGALAEPTFDPYFKVYNNSEPQSPSSFAIEFGLEQGSQASAIVFYIPRDWGVAHGEEIALGTKVGQLSSHETLGLINAACNTVIPIDFDLLNASLDSTVTVPFRLSETGYEVGPDMSFRFLGPEFAADNDGNGLADAVDHYPDFLRAAFGEAAPLARLAAVTRVAGIPILLQFLIFPPATRLQLPDPELTRQFADVPDSGYPVVMVLQDFGNYDRAHEPGPISDHCAPRQAILNIFAPDGGPSLLVSPQSGTYGFKLVAVSIPDADSDGIENSLDACPFVVNVGNSMIPNDGDLDGDGLDVACDPNDDPLAGGANSEQDADAYLNRQDNCPLVSNGQRYDSAGAQLDSPADQADADFDDIGDACDPNPDTPDGEAIVATRSVEVIVGDPSGSGGPPNADACPHCYRPGAEPAEAEAVAEGTGGQLAVAVGLIAVGASAGAVLVGGGTMYLLRRRRE